MTSAFAKISNATTIQELRAAIVEEMGFRAWQERAVSTIGRTTKADREGHEHAARALEQLASDIDMLAASAFLAESPLPVVDAQAVSNIIDGPREDSHNCPGIADSTGRCGQCGIVLTSELHPSPADRRTRKGIMPHTFDEVDFKPLEAVVGDRAKDFMFMGVVPARAIIRYKHCDTRRYLNIAPTSLRTYKFLSLTGQYVEISRDEALAWVFA